MSLVGLAESAGLTDRQVGWRLFLTCWLVYAAHFATNTVREVYPALSLGDHLSFDVSEYLGLHPDIFAVEDGRAFINNNPGTSILGAIPYTLARPIIDPVIRKVLAKRREPGSVMPKFDSPWPMAREFFRRSYERGYDIKFGLGAGVMQAGLMAPLSALSVVVAFVVLRSRTRSSRMGLWLALLYAFATPIFFRTGQLNQNLLVMHCAFFAFVLLWRPWDEGDNPRRPAYLLAGLLCGWAVVCDYSGVIVPIVLGSYGLARRRSLPASVKRPTDACLFVAGVLASGAVLAGYQWSCFGSPWYPAQHYMPAVAFTTQGYQGFSWPALDLLWATAFDQRYGLFVSAPLLLLAFWIPAWVSPRRLFGRLELTCILGFSAFFFVFCSANQYGRMQFNTGVRHIVPAVPFLFLLVANVLVRVPRWVFIPVAVVGTLWSWSLAMYRDVEFGPHGVLDSVLSLVTDGPQWPWLNTLGRIGSALPAYATGSAAAWVILLGLMAAIAILWTVRLGQRASSGSPLRS